METNWYNYIMGEYEVRNAPSSDEEALPLLPQIPAAQNLYHLHRKMGKSVLEAMKLVLEIGMAIEDT